MAWGVPQVAAKHHDDFLLVLGQGHELCVELVVAGLVGHDVLQEAVRIVGEKGAHHRPLPQGVLGVDPG